MSKWDPQKPDTTPKSSRPDMDDFWDVENLLPSRPTRRPPPPPRSTPAAVDVELTPQIPSRSAGGAEPVGAVPLTCTVKNEENGHTPTPESTAAEGTRDRSSSHGATAPEVNRYAPPKKAEASPSEPLADYIPEGALLHRVRVYGWQANYHYFDSFVEDALRYDVMPAPKTAEKVTFFSYFPQYVQLNRSTRAWYLFWREHVRRGQYPDTDYAYILLYLFELINLPVADLSEARGRRDLMAATWVAYRRSYPQLDHYMCEWMCDYCLIYGLAAPVDILATALDDIIMESRLKEFYLSAAVRIPEGEGKENRSTALQTARILMRHCCQYDYRKSKFAQGEHKALFDRTIPAAVAHVLPMLLGANGQKPAISMLDSTVTRDAYTGALCSYRNKRRIEVSYTSFSRSHELRFLIGDMVKHVENRLRSWIGVRSRLSVMSLPLPLRDALDAYLAPLEPPKSAPPVKKKEEPRPAYEALYDLPRKEVSLADAAAIEADSWETTRILVEAFEGEGNQEKPAENVLAVEQASAKETPAAPMVSVDPTTAALVSVPSRDANESTVPAADSPLAPYAPFIKATLDGDSAALIKAAKALGKMPDALADEINALTADGEIGDIILEDDGMGGYTVIEDYRDAVAAMIQE
ncbi:MAG: TerB N-terminal domain-containing protein [Clostridia bacterium]|nr:TerB N-terminal domain-containing protein [Clostridia bacterium]